jgi:hypothetical protein
MATWKVRNINCVLNQNGKQNIVKEVEFIVDDLVNGVVEIPYVDGNFLSYNDLTEDVVIGWVKAALTDSIVAAFEDRANELKAPPTTGYKPLPWG